MMRQSHQHEKQVGELVRMIVMRQSHQHEKQVGELLRPDSDASVTST